MTRRTPQTAGTPPARGPNARALAVAGGSVLDRTLLRGNEVLRSPIAKNLEQSKQCNVPPEL